MGSSFYYNKFMRGCQWLFLFFLGYFFLCCVLLSDPDFGWHLKMGELILAKGFPYTDPFSYTMPSFPVVSHEWMMDIFLSKAFFFLSKGGLAVVFALSAIGAFGLSIFSVKRNARSLFFIPTVLALFAVSPFIGIRPQIITWLFFSVVIVFIRDHHRFRRFGSFFPVLFLLWANMHGGFALGIITLGFSLLYWVWQRKFSWQWAGIFFSFCLGATMITPYGYRMWWEILLSMSDASLRWNIQEWMPIIVVRSLPFWGMVVLSLVFVFRYWWRFCLLDRLLYLGLFLAMSGSARHAPLWLLIALPLTIEGLYYFQQEVMKIKAGAKRFRVALRGLGLIVFFLCSQYVIEITMALISREDTYPVHAIAYLRESPSKGNLFSIYGWGGYLIWQYPEKKVFIDGRMPSWRWEVNLPRESNYAFADYKKLLTDESGFTAVTARFHIDTLLLPNFSEQSENTLKVQASVWMNKTFSLPIDEDILISRTITRAKHLGWREVYQDDSSIILRKN
jgi:hypothetical protein